MRPAFRAKFGSKSGSGPARVLALLTMAISDAAVASFETKYHYNFWRPETAIRAADTDDNPKTDANPTFMPYVVTPCFPSYGSNHTALSNAGREELERIYDNRRHSISLSNAAVPGVTLKYSRLKQVTDDIDDSRRRQESALGYRGAVDGPHDIDILCRVADWRKRIVFLSVAPSGLQQAPSSPLRSRPESSLRSIRALAPSHPDCILSQVDLKWT